MMKDNFSNLFAESVNKKYIEKLDLKELDNILSILDKSNNAEYEEISNKNNSINIVNTQRTGIAKHRVGQEIFRRKLLIKFNKKCAVTGIDEEEILLASHILPWKDADNFQRLDIENGILLNPFYDKLFDKFYISFSDKGKIVLSEKLKSSQKLMELIDSNSSINVTQGMKKYLRIHRKNLKN